MTNDHGIRIIGDSSPIFVQKSCDEIEAVQTCNIRGHNGLTSKWPLQSFQFIVIQVAFLFMIKIYSIYPTFTIFLIVPPIMCNKCTYK